MKKTSALTPRGTDQSDRSEAIQNDSSAILEQHIGSELRRIRLAQRLTIAEVANKAGITGGMVSKLENAQSSASLDTLHNMTRALGVTLGALFQGFPPAEGGAQMVKKGRGMEVVRRGTKRGHTYHLLAAERGPRRMFEPFLVTLTDKSEVFQRFEHSGTEFLHILEGRIEYRHGRHTYMMSPGDSLTFKGAIPHGPERLVRLPIVMLSIIVYGPESHNA